MEGSAEEGVGAEAFINRKVVAVFRTIVVGKRLAEACGQRTQGLDDRPA